MKILTTGIGSVPFRNLRDAMDYVFEFSVPYLPEMPGADFMQRTLNMAGGKLPVELPSFAAEVARRRLPQAKLQMAGPLTLKYFQSEGWKKIGQKGFREAVLKLIRAMRAETSAELCLFFDEPAIDSALDEEEVQLLKDCLTYVQVEGVRTGIHCCNSFVMEDLLKLRPHFLSFDLLSMASEVEAAGTEINKFLEHNGTLVWGAISSSPTKPAPAAPGAPDADEPLKLIPKYSRSEVWLSPACGLSGWAEGRAKSVPSALKNLITL